MRKRTFILKSQKLMKKFESCGSFDLPQPKPSVFLGGCTVTLLMGKEQQRRLWYIGDRNPEGLFIFEHGTH